MTAMERALQQLEQASGGRDVVVVWKMTHPDHDNGQIRVDVAAHLTHGQVVSMLRDVVEDTEGRIGGH